MFQKGLNLGDDLKIAHTSLLDIARVLVYTPILHPLMVEAPDQKISQDQHLNLYKFSNLSCYNFNR